MTAAVAVCGKWNAATKGGLRGEEEELFIGLHHIHRNVYMYVHREWV